MAYHINDINLAEFGLIVNRFKGLEILPKRKGSAFYNFPDMNGIVPFLEQGEVFFESRDISIVSTIIGSSDVDAQNKLANLFDLLSSTTLLTLKVDRLSRQFECMYIGGVNFELINDNVSGQVGYKGTIVLKEINPLNELLYGKALDYDDAEFLDYNHDDFEILY